MNLFRSEEHVRSWTDYEPASREAMMPLASWVRVFQAPRYRARLDPDHLLTRFELRPTSDEVRAEEIATLRARGYWAAASRGA